MLALGYAWAAIHVPAQLEMVVTADRLTQMQVDYEGSPGPDAEHTATYMLAAGGWRRVHLPVRADRIFSLRLHPSRGPVVLRLRSMRVRSGFPGWFGHRVIHDFDLGGLRALRQVDALVPEDGAARIVVGAAADDPCLRIAPPAPLPLGVDWIAAGGQFLLGALGWLVLWLAGLGAGRYLHRFLPPVGRWLLGPTPAGAPPPENRGSRSWMGIVLACVALVLFLREPGFFLHPQFWAEDGKVLFTEARVYGWRSLGMPHPGYYILAQRLVAWLAAGLPALAAPWIYCYAALAYTLLAAWFCLRARLEDLMDQPGRAALALALVLGPQSGEVQMKLIGSQWLLMSILLILLLQDQPRRPGQAAVDLLGLVFAGLTGPYVVLYAPWFLLRLRRAAGGWSRYNAVLAATAGALAFVQAVRIWLTPALPVVMNRQPAAWVYQLMFVLPGGLFFGDTVPARLGRAFYVLSPLALGLLAWALLRGETKRRWAALALIGCGGLAYGAGLRAVAPDLGIDPFGAGERYFQPIYTAALWLGVLYCHDASKRLRVASTVALGMMLMASASRFKGQEWPDLRWSDYAPRLDAGDAVQLPVLPGWEIQIPARN